MKLNNAKVNIDDIKIISFPFVIILIILLFLFLWFILIIILSKEVSFIYSNDILSLYNLSSIGQYSSGTIGVTIAIATLLFLFFNLNLLKKQIQIQGLEIRKQQFDKTFFDMMNIMDKIVSENSENGESGFAILLKMIREYINIRNKDDWFAKLANQLGYTKEAVKASLGSKEGEREDATKEYAIIQKLTNYIHHIEMIVNIINSSNILTNEEKMYYLKILYSRLNIEVIGFLNVCIEDASLFPNSRQALRILLNVDNLA